MVYLEHCCFMAFSSSGLHVPCLRYWTIGVIQVSVLAFMTARHSTNATLGCLSQICMTNLWWLFFLVVDSRDNALARLFSCRRMCSSVSFWTEWCCCGPVMVPLEQRLIHFKFPFDLTDHNLGVALASYLASSHVIRQLQPGKKSFVLGLVIGALNPN